VADPVKILIVNGPNLNLLGIREPDIYGRETLANIEQRCVQKAKALGFEITMRQSNHEGELIDWIHEAVTKWSAIIINPAAYTHTSVAIMDALKLVNCPIVEVHISNIYQRETFRHHSYVSPVATGVICGFGSAGYEVALEAISGLLRKKEED
jgi:3-dehydroquinate dehydratase-2